jgi:hypothetical protein
MLTMGNNRLLACTVGYNRLSVMNYVDLRNYILHVALWTRLTSCICDGTERVVDVRDC